MNTKLIEETTEVINGETVDVEIHERRNGSRFKAIVKGGFLQHYQDIKPEEKKR